MNKKMRNLLQYILFLGFGFFLFWLTLRKSSWHEITHNLAGTNFIFLIPATVSLLFAHFFRAVRWKIMIEPLGYRPSTQNTFLSVLVGYWANLAFPRLGEVLKCTILARYEKVPADKLVGTILAERAFDFVTLLIVLGITIIVQYDIVGMYTLDEFKKIFQSRTGHISYTRIIGAAIFFIALVLATNYFIRRFAHLSFIQKTKQILLGIWAGLTSVRNIRNKGWFFFHSVLIWLFYLISTYMGFFAMPGMRVYGVKAALSALTFGAIGMVVPSPGGIGSYQYAVQQVLLVYGISEAQGLSLGILIWFCQTAILLIFGTLSFVLLPILNKKKP
ncbi:MAG TPA: lysylphosphatidylglycerol synthase transmembrane domain-containing protein [Puia sp.]|nr:lysylphosphatidylglycerol synthase transmembrane domain-containing protein [Puia sp.]